MSHSIASFIAGAGSVTVTYQNLSTWMASNFCHWLWKPEAVRADVKSSFIWH